MDVNCESVGQRDFPNATFVKIKQNKTDDIKENHYRVDRENCQLTAEIQFLSLSLIVHLPPGSFESTKLDGAGTLSPPARIYRKDKSS